MDFLLSLLAGVLLAIPFYLPNLALIEWIGLIPLLFALEDKGLKESFYLAWLMGFVFFMISSHWVLYPLANFSGYSLLICFFILVIGALFLSLYYGLFGILVSFLNKRVGFSPLFLIPLVWTGIEFLRGVFSFEFLFSFLGYSQAFIPELVQLAQYGGVYLITFFIIFINTLLYLGLKNKSSRYIISGILLFFVIFSYGWLVLNQDRNIKEELAVGIVQPAIPQKIKMSSNHQGEVVNRILNLSVQELNKNSPDLLIWPETAILRSYDKRRCFPYLSSSNAPLFVGGLIKSKKGYKNSSLLIDKKGKIKRTYSKIRLVPFGEYVPCPRLIPDIIESNLNHLVPGNKIKTFQLNNISWVSPICSEVLNPSYVRKLYNQNDLMINISNEAWFEKSKASSQILQEVVFRAVEHKVPIVKVGNTGISGVIDERGRVLIKTEIFKPVALTYNLKLPHRKKTFYYKFGDLFGKTVLIILLSLIIVACIIKNYNFLR